MPFDGQNFEQQSAEQKAAVLDRLCRARERVARPGGWCPRVIWDEAAAYCALGAIWADGQDRLSIDATKTLARALPRPWVLAARIIGVVLQLDEPQIARTAIEWFNDARWRMQAEIVVLFDGAITMLVAEEGRTSAMNRQELIDEVAEKAAL